MKLLQAASAISVSEPSPPTNLAEPMEAVAALAPIQAGWSAWPSPQLKSAAGRVWCQVTGLPPGEIDPVIGRDEHRPCHGRSQRCTKNNPVP